MRAMSICHHQTQPPIQLHHQNTTTEPAITDSERERLRRGKKNREIEREEWEMEKREIEREETEMEK